MSTSSTNCPSCGEPIPEDAPGGLCPRCALSGAAAAATDLRLAFETPPLEEIAAAFPNLEILELTGRGGMGAVYRARQSHLDREVALKILPPVLAERPGFTERFTREGRVLAKLNHPHIVTVHDFGESGGFFFLIMEFVEGVNLRQAMQTERFTPEQALALVPKICEALQFAHDEGVLHRDIKPENILLNTKGRVKIADFGIAKLLEDEGLDPALTALETPGTPHYMAPEQIERPKEVDHRADIYSLGVVFYELLTGELPIGRFAPPSEKSEVDAKVDEVVFRSLEKERERRQQSADEMRTQVETLSGPPPGVPGEPPAPAAAARAGWGPLRAMLMSVGALMIPIVLLILLRAIFMSAQGNVSDTMVQHQVQENITAQHLEVLRREMEPLMKILNDGPAVAPAAFADADYRFKELQAETREIRNNRARIHHSPTPQVGVAWFSLARNAGLAITFFALSGTILGWREARRLRGLGIRKGRRAAMTAAWFWPLLLIDAMIFAVCMLPFSLAGGGLALMLGGVIALIPCIVVDTLLIWLGVYWLGKPVSPEQRAAAAEIPTALGKLFIAAAIIASMPLLLVFVGVVMEEVKGSRPFTLHQAKLADFEEEQFSVSVRLDTQRTEALNLNVKVKYRGPEMEILNNGHETMHPGQGMEWDLFGETLRRSNLLNFSFPDRATAARAAAQLEDKLSPDGSAEFNDLSHLYLFHFQDDKQQHYWCWIELGQP